MSNFQSRSQTVSQTTAGASTDQGPINGHIEAVSYERPAAGAITTSSLVTIGRGSSADLVISFNPVGTTAVNTFYPRHAVHSTAGAVLASTDGHQGAVIPFVDQSITANILAGTSTGATKTVDLKFYWDGLDLGLTATS